MLTMGEEQVELEVLNPDIGESKQIIVPSPVLYVTCMDIGFLYQFYHFHLSSVITLAMFSFLMIQ